MLDYPQWLDHVRYKPDLDGGGRALAPVFAEALKGRKFDRCFEWCAGPAWIGFWLLENGICEELVTGDINPEAVEVVNNTAAATGWPVTAYCSDNMQDIPETEKFDLVVANPPNYFDIQAAHPLGHLRFDPRPSDPGWRAHAGFYSTIREYLTPEAEIWVS